MENASRLPVDGPARLRRLDQLSHFLDNAIRIPGIGYRIGYDAIIGLIPGVGDLVGMALSAYIVLEAARLRLPFSTILRMMANVAIEALVGAIPLLGDLFDATWKANARNMALVRARVEGSGGRVEVRRQDRRFFFLLGLALIVMLIVLAVAVVLVLQGIGALLGF